MKQRNDGASTSSMASKEESKSFHSRSELVPMLVAQNLKHVSDGEGGCDGSRKRQRAPDYTEQVPQAPVDVSCRSTPCSVIRPTSLPRDKSFLSSDFYGAAVGGGLGRADGEQPKISSHSNEFGRRSFVEWRRNMPESAAFRTSPLWNTPPALGLNIHDAGQGWGKDQHSFAALGPGSQTYTRDCAAPRERPFLFLGPSRVGEEPAASIPVVMEGRCTIKSINLQDHNDYASFALAMKNMHQEINTLEECNLASAVPAHLIAYEDDEGDVLLVGDLPWRAFVKAARKIKILRSEGSRTQYNTMQEG